MLKELIWKINHEENWEKQQGMLEMLNEIYGLKLGLLAGEVVWFTNPDASTCFKYAGGVRDAYTHADELEDFIKTMRG